MRPKPLDMIRSRGSGGHHGLSLTAPLHRGVAKLHGTIIKYRKAGRIRGARVSVGTTPNLVTRPTGRGRLKAHTHDLPYTYSYRKDTPYIHSLIGIHKSRNMYNYLPHTHSQGIHKPHNRHNASQYISYIHSQHTQPSQQPLWIPMHGFLVAGRGIEQADGGLGPIPPRVQGQPKQNLTSMRRVDMHSHQ